MNNKKPEAGLNELMRVIKANRVLKRARLRHWGEGWVNAATSIRKHVRWQGRGLAGVCEVGNLTGLCVGLMT